MTEGLTREARRLRAPVASGDCLVRPALDESDGVATANRAALRKACYDLQGRCLSEVSREARRDLVAEALRWTRAYRQVPDDARDPAAETIVLAGHQPQLFHPGVWFKNFALAAVARRLNAVPVNLLIDTDTLKHNALPVPGGSIEEPQRRTIPMDRAATALPFEERRILDQRCFEAFGRRVADQIAPLVGDPLIRDWWPTVVARSRKTDNLGACLAQARHQLEGRWGLSTLEAPESTVCRSAGFRWFAVHLLAELPRFRAAYNAAVAEYRRRNRIRSAAHPVPDLASDGPWLEAPFWVWTTDDPLRRRLFARQSGDRIELWDRRALRLSLPVSPKSGGDRAADELARWERQGVKIRARALITTLWARLALGDLFIHGIGGAKYDRVTDELISRFFGLKPPAFLVVSATLHLPVASPNASEAEARLVRHRLRELDFHPELHVDEAAGPNGGEGPRPLVAAKRRWIEVNPEGSEARRRFREIRRINHALQPWVERQRRDLVAERDRVDRALRAKSILQWREYAFCLYPEKTLQEFLRALLPKSV